jgi:hypothetical protein
VEIFIKIEKKCHICKSAENWGKTGKNGINFKSAMFGEKLEFLGFLSRAGNIEK